MRIENSLKLNFDDVLICPKRSNLSSRKEVKTTRTFTFCNSKCTWKGVPIMVANMDTTGTFEMANSLAENQIITCIHKHYSIEEWRTFLSTSVCNLQYVAVSTGIQESDIKKLNLILKMNSNFKFICIDVANGYSKMFLNAVKAIRNQYPSKIIIAGNVVTGEMTEELILSGVDIVKVGIGPGSVCTTRKKTGVGYPQLSAVIECADAAHGLRGHIISDGGCTCPGDFVKAFGGGADFVMAGGLFAGHDESAGEIVIKDGLQYKLFYGMSSEYAMKKNGKKEEIAKYRTSEGKIVYTSYKGNVQNTVQDILGGIRSGCTYIGAYEIKEINKRTTFIRTNKQLNTIYT
tara:strand:- start:1218 stop:2258 length:1041 start_codon:yes stop_codon:yes gene_type:complete